MACRCPHGGTHSAYHPSMASITTRSGSYRIEWRLGGRRGRKQSVTLPELHLANAAKALAEAHRHRITDDEVYKAVLGLDQLPADTTLTPTLAEWITEWGDRKSTSPHQHLRNTS